VVEHLHLRAVDLLATLVAHDTDEPGGRDPLRVEPRGDGGEPREHQEQPVTPPCVGHPRGRTRINRGS